MKFNKRFCNTSTASPVKIQWYMTRSISNHMALSLEKLSRHPSTKAMQDLNKPSICFSFNSFVLCTMHVWVLHTQRIQWRSLCSDVFSMFLSLHLSDIPVPITSTSVSNKQKAISWSPRVATAIDCLKQTGDPYSTEATLWPRQNCRHFAEDILSAFSWMKIYECWLRFVPNGPINNIPALFQIMARCPPGGKPLSETTMA